ncbi:MAG: 4Fe-4S dicluster domain-containing protein, partial [Eubacterium sp.]
DFKALTETEVTILNEAGDVFRKTKTIPCTGCRYCMDCPSDVDIPKLFNLYNEYRLGEDKGDFVNGYNALGETKQEKQCVNCGQCVEQCPQNIDIPEALKKITTLAERLI